MTAWKASSQNTIQISLYQANEAILNAKKVLTLDQKIAELDRILLNQDDHIRLLENTLDNERMKFNLLQENYQILETQYEAEKAVKKPSTWWEFALIGMGAFGLGFMAGSL